MTAPSIDAVRGDVPLVALTMSSRPQGEASTLPPYRGLTIALDDLYAVHGAAPIEVVLFDSDGDLDRVRRQAEQIVADERFVAVIGPMGSSEALVSAPLFSEAGLLQVSPCASHPDVCRQGLRTFARLVANEEDQGRALARLARDRLGAARAAVVLEDDVFGRTVLEYFTGPFEQLGGEVVAVATYQEGDRDFDALASAVSAPNPDVVVFGVHPLEGALASAAIRDAGVTVPFLGTDAMKPNFYLGGGTPDAPAYHTHSGADFRRLPQAARFRDAYVSRYPEDSTYSPEAYDATMLVAAAIGAADPCDRQGVLAAFQALGPLEGITGTLAFDDAGERRDAPVGLYEVRLDGEGRVMHFLGTIADVLGT